MPENYVHLNTVLTLEIAHARDCAAPEILFLACAACDETLEFAHPPPIFYRGGVKFWRRAPYIYAGASQEAAQEAALQVAWRAGLQLVVNAILICLHGLVMLFDCLKALPESCCLPA